MKESTPSTATTTTATHVSTKAKEDLKGPDSDDDVMKIVKNVPHSSEYNKKKEVYRMLCFHGNFPFWYMDGLLSAKRVT